MTTYRRKNSNEDLLGPSSLSEFDTPSSPKKYASSPSTAKPSLRRVGLRFKHSFSARPRFWTGLIITILSFVTRFWILQIPEYVCWDETHFGKFANHYIKGEFYFDVHPPLGKMMIGLAGALTGYGGEHEFKEPGQKYGDSHYMGMRAICAFLGALIPTCVYGIMTDLDFSAEASALAALMIVFDTGMLTLSRFILLDPFLLFFIILSVYCYCHFYKLRDRPFSTQWYKWMFYTGIALACAFGTKWVGLFVILFIGMSVVLDLWDLIGDLNLSVYTLNRHFFSRVAGLIILPIALYVLFFAIHFGVLRNSGPGDGYMSSAFQTTLKGNPLFEMENPRELAYGSQMSIKSYRISGALLHSHPDTYPKEVGPPQQQVTTYSHKDNNNHWRVKKADREPSASDPIEYVRHGDLIRLEHVNTRRNLHSHNEKAPITTKHKQVTCYGQDGVGDQNDVWEILLDGYEKKEGVEPPKIELLTSKFRLVHKEVKCALSNQGVNLPKWGWEQGEVTCNPATDESGSLWNIETIMDDRLPKSSVQDLAPSFWYNLLELHAAMANVNNNLLPKENEVVSRPWHWPILYKGQHFTPWGVDDIRIFLMGNPVIWFGNLVCMALFLVGFVINAILQQRGYESPFFKARRHKLQSNGTWIAAGFLIHYIPFFFMSRVLYFHHYFPAHIFACMLTAIVLDEVFYWIWVVAFRFGMTQSKRLIHVLASMCVLIYVGSFIYFSPWSYGMTGPNSKYEGMKLLSTWDFV